ILPGDPASQALGMNAEPERAALLRAELGLDRPLPQRYVDWLGGLLTGDFGVSALTRQPVGPVIGEHAGRSLILAAGALLIVVCVAVPAGIVAGSRPGTARDRATSLGALAMLSIPEFVLATLLITVFAHGLGWFPPVSLVGGGSGALAEPAKLVLPIVTLAAVAGSFTIRLTRAAVAEAAASAHVEAARLAGIREPAVLIRHLLPSVRAPIAQALALAIPYLVGGALVVETAFGYPGLAALVAEAAANRDAVLLGGAGMVLATVAVTGFWLAELAGRHRWAG
ncbi:ABC transporter permease, partial [Phytoactinopolyspora endophytica]|uniref:ABC transporter permease n=1 Tax=Phytoactinopolyspora endophytica TaxID=1642495 RepID=UPI0013EDE97F